LGGATRDVWERESVGGVASGLGGALQTTLSPALVVKGDKIPWLTARLSDTETGRCEGGDKPTIFQIRAARAVDCEWL